MTNDFGHECSRALLGRAIKDLLWRTNLYHASSVHHDDTVCGFANEAHLMAHEKHRDPFAREIPDHIQDIPDQFWVKRCRYFIKEDQRRLERQSAGDSDPLLLTS